MPGRHTGNTNAIAAAEILNRGLPKNETPAATLARTLIDENGEIVARAEGGELLGPDGVPIVPDAAPQVVRYALDLKPSVPGIIEMYYSAGPAEGDYITITAGQGETFYTEIFEFGTSVQPGSNLIPWIGDAQTDWDNFFSQVQDKFSLNHGLVFLASNDGASTITMQCASSDVVLGDMDCEAVSGSFISSAYIQGTEAGTLLTIPNCTLLSVTAMHASVGGVDVDIFGGYDGGAVIFTVAANGTAFTMQTLPDMYGAFGAEQLFASVSTPSDLNIIADSSPMAGRTYLIIDVLQS